MMRPLRSSLRLAFGLGFALAALPLLGAQNPPLKKLSFEQAFLNQPPHLLKPVVTSYEWLDDEHYLLPQRDERGQLVRLNRILARTGESAPFLDFTLIQKALPEGLAAAEYAERTADYSTLLYSYRSDLYLYQQKTGVLRRLTATRDEERNPRFSPDGRRLAFTRLNDLYALDLESGLEYRLTTDGSETVYNGSTSWVYFEEILGRASRYAAFWWAPAGDALAFFRFDESMVPAFPIVHAAGIHGGLELERYPKAGDPNPAVRLGIARPGARDILWADLPALGDHYLAWPRWTPSGERLLVQWMNRGQENVKVYLVDPRTGLKQEIYDERQPTWVPFFDDLTLLADGRGFLLRSDREGWSHIYFCDFKGLLQKRLTSGEWAVVRITRVDEKTGWVWFLARVGRSTETHLCRVKLDGTGFERLTQEPGTHRSILSPGGSYFLDTFSSLTSPPRQDLYAGDGTFIGNIDQSRTPQYSEYGLGRAELFTIRTDDGWDLPAVWVLPPDFDPAKKYPVLFSVYGGPGVASVTNAALPLSASYYAQEGVIWIRVDHRGSGHFGKKGAALMHRNLGSVEMRDWIAAVKWLRTKPFVDPARVGITGGSYGGYATCLALTYGADYFTHGLATSPVTDWRLYDTVYAERYMDMPTENSAGYDAASILVHSVKLKGVLFLIHGELDDNVHLQNTVQLIDRLTDLGKPFGFMLYPGERHNLSGKKREHAARLAVDFWLKHLLGR